MSTRGWVATLLVATLAAGAGWFVRGRFAPRAGAAAGGKEGPCPGGAKPLYWKAPMDPTYIRKEPGKSPMGMDLVPVCPGEESASQATGIRIPSEVLLNIGVRTARVERRDLARRIRAVGRVDYDERLVAHVHTKFQGWVEKLFVDYEGALVRAGEPLLAIYSPELVSTQEELLLAARYRETTARSPFEDVRRGGLELFEATRRRLELFDIPDRDIRRLLRTGRVRKSLTLYAPTSGVVTHLMVREGHEVRPNERLYTIADLSRVWVYADVYEYELPWVHVGEKVRVELSYLPRERFEGKLTYVYPFLDPKTRTVRVRAELENPKLLLKPDMFANVVIEAEPRKGVLAIPDEAVIRSGRRNIVVVALGGGRFDPREVELGMDSGDGWIEIRRGLAEGEEVVTSGQFLIDSESRLQEAVQKLLAPEEEPKGNGGGPQGEVPLRPGSAPHQGMKMPPGAAMPHEPVKRAPGRATPPEAAEKAPAAAMPREGTKTAPGGPRPAEGGGR